MNIEQIPGVDPASGKDTTVWAWRLPDGSHHIADTRTVGKLIQDFEAESPRDWDNLGTMVCWHNRYNLGDEQPKESPYEYRLALASVYKPTLDEHVSDEQDQIIDTVLDEHYIILPLYLYEHSGITMDTSGFSCPWDSGQVGFIYIDIIDAKREMRWEKLSPQRRQQLIKQLMGEVEVYDQFITGDVWGFEVVREARSIEDDDRWVKIEELDSCWGFFGDDIETNGIKDHTHHLTIDHWEHEYE